MLERLGSCLPPLSNLSIELTDLKEKVVQVFVKQPPGCFFPFTPWFKEQAAKLWSPPSTWYHAEHSALTDAFKLTLIWWHQTVRTTNLQMPCREGTELSAWRPEFEPRPQLRPNTSHSMPLCCLLQTCVLWVIFLHLLPVVSFFFFFSFITYNSKHLDIHKLYNQ